MSGKAPIFSSQIPTTLRTFHRFAIRPISSHRFICHDRAERCDWNRYGLGLLVSDLGSRVRRICGSGLVIDDGGSDPPSLLVALLSGLLLPGLIVGIPFVLMNLPNAGGGEGMLFAGCVIWALLSLPICLAGSITVFVFLLEEPVSADADIADIR
jgi:hypothetical protein